MDRLKMAQDVSMKDEGENDIRTFDGGTSDFRASDCGTPCCQISDCGTSDCGTLECGKPWTVGHDTKTEGRLNGDGCLRETPGLVGQLMLEIF